MGVPTAVAGGAAGSAGVGIAWMVVATALFISMDTISKVLSADYPILQVAWARFAFHTLFAGLVLAPRLPRLLRSRRPGIQTLRSGLLLSVTVLMFVSLSHLPLMFVTGVMALTPVLVTALSVPILKETVGWRRWLGVALGLSGALVVVGPAMTGVSLIVLVPLAAALVNANYMITTRLLRESDPPATTLLFTALVGTVLCSVPLPFVWVAPDPAGWGLLALLGALGALSHLCLILAYTHAPAAVVVPFTYLTLVWAPILGFIVFAEVPTVSTVGGSLLIMGSGLYIFYREQVRGRRDR